MDRLMPGDVRIDLTVIRSFNRSDYLHDHCRILQRELKHQTNLQAQQCCMGRVTLVVLLQS